MSNQARRGSRSEPNVAPIHTLDQDHSHSFPRAVSDDPSRSRSLSTDVNSSSGASNIDSTFTANGAVTGSEYTVNSSSSVNTSMYNHSRNSSDDSSGTDRTLMSGESQTSGSVPSQRPMESSNVSQYSTDPGTRSQVSYSEYTIGSSDGSRNSTQASSSSNRSQYTTDATHYSSEAAQRLMSNRSLGVQSMVPGMLTDVTSYNSSLRGPEVIQRTDLTFSGGFQTPSSTLVDDRRSSSSQPSTDPSDRTLIAESYSSSAKSHQTSNSTHPPSSDPRSSSNYSSETSNRTEYASSNPNHTPVCQQGYSSFTHMGSQGPQTPSQPHSALSSSSPSNRTSTPSSQTTRGSISNNTRHSHTSNNTSKYTVIRSEYPSRDSGTLQMTPDASNFAHSNGLSSDLRLTQNTSDSTNGTLDCSRYPIQDSRLYSHPSTDSRMRTLSGSYATPPSLFESDPRMQNRSRSEANLTYNTEDSTQIPVILAADPRISRSRSMGSINMTKSTTELRNNDDNIKEVSMAIKQYMDEADIKQHDLHTQIDSLHRKLDASNLHIQHIEKEKANERAQFVRDKQAMLVSHQEIEKKLEVSLFDKDDQLRLLKKMCDKQKTTIEELDMEKNMELEEMQKIMETAEAGFVEERLKFEEFVKELHARIEALNGELLKSHQKDNITRSAETRLVMEIQLKNQQLNNKHETIAELNDKVESLKEELKSSQEVVTSNSQENTQLVEFGTALKFELSKMEESLIEQNEESERLKDELARTKQQLECIESKMMGSIENEVCLQDANESSHQMLMRMQHNLEDLKEKNEHLVDTIKEYAFRENQLNLKVEELTLNETKLIEASSKSESKVKKEVENISNKMRKSSASQKQEIETLKETIRKLSNDHQKSLFDWQTAERDLRDRMQAGVHEVNKSLEEEKRNVQVLQAQLEQSYIIINDLEGRSQQLTRKSSDADAQLLDLEVNKTELQVQLEHQTKLLENLENNYKHSSDKDKQRKSLVSQLRKKVKELEESLEAQSDELKRSKEERENISVDLKDMTMRKEQLEGQGKRLGGSLLEMNHFMQRTRKEVEQLRIENEHQVAANLQLSQNIEKFKSKHSQVVEKQQSDQEIVMRCQIDLKESKIRLDAYEMENGTLKAQVHERMVALEQIMKENDKYKDSFTQLETTVENQKRNYQAKLHECEAMRRRVEELTAKLEEKEEAALTSKQTYSSSQLETEALQKDLRTAKMQREEVMRERDNLSNQLEHLSRERLRFEEQIKSLTINLQSANEDNTTLTKDKIALSEYAKKLETDIAKGLKALQQQDAEITDLSNIKREMQESVRLMKEQVMTSENQTARLLEEIEEGEKRLKEAQMKLKKVEKHMEMDVNAKDKLRIQNSSMKIKMEELSQKQSFHTGIIESHKVGYNDLMKQYKKLEVDNDKLLTQNGEMKARAIEMQAIVDGTIKKQDWNAQNEKDYQGEIQRLRQQNKSMTDDLLTLKEEMLKAKMRCERLDDDLSHKTADLEACNKELDSRCTSFQNRDKDATCQIKKLEDQNLQFKNKMWDLQHGHDTMKEQCAEANNCLEKAKELCEKKEEKIEKLNEELTELKVQIQKYADDHVSIASKNEKLQQNFQQLVVVMRKLKHERDQLSNLIKRIEDENEKLTEQCKKLKNDIFNANREVDNGKANEHQLQEDIEQLKSRINVLKYTETLRTSENKELTEKLSKYEAQLKEMKQDQHDAYLYAASTPTPNRDTPTSTHDSEWLQQSMVLELCQRLKDCSTRKGATSQGTTLTDKYKEEMKSFMDDLFIKRHQQQYESKPDMKRSASFPVFHNSVRRPHYRPQQRQPAPTFIDRHNNNTNFNQMESLYQETKHIQASLLNDIKKLSRNFAEQRRF
ncbi:early endosome antigen 1-like [Clytia hemisphaerica]|uniref:Uncharacterized protein n=1 Tax=Clytia hemisphaerica TaxID=252671 RepID=A0A7M5XCW0_9CNID